MVTTAHAPRPALVTTAVLSVLLTLIFTRPWHGSGNSSCSSAGQLAPGAGGQSGKVLVFQHIYAINNYKEVVQDQARIHTARLLLTCPQLLAQTLASCCKSSTMCVLPVADRSHA